MRRQDLIATQLPSTIRRVFVPLAFLALAVSPSIACRTSVKEESRNVVVNAPADGVVRRVLVGEGAAVEKNTAIIEIAVQPAHADAPQPASARAEQVQALRATQTALASAEGEASRTAADVKRIEPLVKKGLASQAELDKARVQSQDSAERLLRAREKAKDAEEHLKQQSSAVPNEEVIAVRAPAAGVIQTLIVHAGQPVANGQTLATMISSS